MRLIATCVVAALLVALAPSGAVQAAEDTCSDDFKIMTVRGSNQGNDTGRYNPKIKPVVNWNNRENQGGEVRTATFHNIVQALTAEAKLRGKTVDPKVDPVYSADGYYYPAVNAVSGTAVAYAPVFGLLLGPIGVTAGLIIRQLNPDDDIVSSAAAGVDVLTNMVNAEFARCGTVNPNRRVIIIGHSQGAQVAGDTLQGGGFGDNVDKVALILAGDPRMNGSSWSVRAGIIPTGPSGNDGLNVVTRPEYDSSLRGRVISICHALDFICQGIGSGHGMADHGTYIGLAVATRARIDAQFDQVTMELGSMPSVAWSHEESVQVARELMSRLAPRSQLDLINRPVDLMFAVDLAHPANDIDQLKSDARYFIEELTAKTDRNLRVGIAGYGVDGKAPTDSRDSTYQVIIQPTDDFDAIAAALETREATTAVQEGSRSDMYASVREAATTTTWRTDAHKAIILLTDTPNSSAESVNDAQAASVVKELQPLGISVSGRAYGTDPKTVSDILLLSQGTGGIVIGTGGTAMSGSDHEAGSGIAGVLSPAPVVNAGGPYRFYQGATGYVTAEHSYDKLGSIERYQWDLDSNGSWECDSTFDPRCKVDTSALLGQTATLRVTNDLGSIAQTSTSLNIVPAPTTQ